jgi:hypothetical protein
VLVSTLYLNTRQRKERTEDRIGFAVLVPRISANQGAKVVVLDFLLVTVDNQIKHSVNPHHPSPRASGHNHAWGSEKRQRAPLDELAPALLALGALHPVLVDLDDLVVRGLRELREVSHQVLEDLVVVSVEGMRLATYVPLGGRGRRAQKRKGGVLGELEVLGLDFFEEIPVCLRARV